MTENLTLRPLAFCQFLQAAGRKVDTVPQDLVCQGQFVF